MAAAVKAKEYTVTTTAATLTAALGLASTAPLFISEATIRSATTNAANVFIGGSDLTNATNRGVFLKPDESFSISLNAKAMSTNALYIVGLNGTDIVNIIVIS